MPRAQGCAGAVKHIHVSLDTRRPASYGPGKTIPAPASAMSVFVLFETIAS
jgi:hypothetical protein